MTSTATITSGLDTVRAEIVRACRDAGADPAGVTLVAVSKTFPAEAIEPVIAAGQRVFGENRVQEAKAKWPALSAADPGLELHLIEPLPVNKAKEGGGWEKKGEGRAGGRSCLSRSTPAPSRRRRACCRRMRTLSSGHATKHTA